MSDFEDFVTTELPLRPALIHGNGSPRVSTPPAVIGTVYREQDADPERFWLRHGASVNEWFRLSPGDTPFLVSKTGGPYTAIQDAIDDAEALASYDNHQVVRVGPGTFTEDINIPRFVSVHGAGSGSRNRVTRLVGTVTVSDSGGYEDPDSSADWRAITGFSFEPTGTDPAIYVRSDNSAPGIVIENCRFVRWSGIATMIDSAISAGIPWTHNPSVWIRRCWFDPIGGTSAAEPVIESADTHLWVVECLSSTAAYLIEQNDTGYLYLVRCVFLGAIFLVGDAGGEMDTTLLYSQAGLSSVNMPSFGSYFYLFNGSGLRSSATYTVSGAGYLWFDVVLNAGTGRMSAKLDPSLYLDFAESFYPFLPSFSSDWLSSPDDVCSGVDELSRRAVRGGAWASRPTTQLFDGRPYYDTTLRKPFWYHVGTALWYDANGTPHP